MISVKMNTGGENAHLFTIGVEESFEFDDVWMRDESHDLEFTIL